MHIGTKLAISLYIVCLALSYQATQAKPVEERLVRTKHDADDWFSSIFADYFDSDDDSEEYLICRNCTVIVGQANATQTTAAPATNAPTAAPTAAPSAVPSVAPSAAPPVAPSAVPSVAPTAAPPAAPTAAPAAAPTN